MRIAFALAVVAGCWTGEPPAPQPPQPAKDDRYTTRGLVTPPVREDLSFQVVIETTKFDVGAWVDNGTLIVAAGLPFTERAGNSFQEPSP